MPAGRVLLFVWLMLAGGPPGGGASPAAEPRRVLLLHSFGFDFAPFNEFSEHFRKALALRVPGRLDYYDVSLISARQRDGQDNQILIDYLKSVFASGAPDLIVPIGGAAVRFVQGERGRFFPAVPVLYAAVDQRIVRAGPMTANDAAVPARNDFPAVVSNILELLPGTKRLAIVMGDSPIERYWVEEIRRDLQPYAQRLELVWFNEDSFEEMKRRAAALPADSAILFALLIVDAAGVSHTLERALTELVAVSKAPVFGLFESQLGTGVVGGRLISNRRADLAADVASRMLGGEAPAGVIHPATEPGMPIYDWRQLRRFGIDVRGLPPGSEMRFREPTRWEQYGGYLGGFLAVVALQAALIAALLLQRHRRRRAEGEALALSGRLLTAHEDERRRLARDLHDDVTQRLARLAIDAASLEKPARTPVEGAAARGLREDLARLSDDVHALSYRLHPSVIEDLGLVEALRAECESVARREALQVDVAAGDVPVRLPRDTALCLFRIAQESLRNVARHAAASVVTVSLERRDGGVLLSVRDNGAGFDGVRANGRASLGHASMRERVRLLGGRLEIDSAPGRGTTVTAWVPAVPGAS